MGDLEWTAATSPACCEGGGYEGSPVIGLGLAKSVFQVDGVDAAARA
jgi:hypothetical protein